MNLSDPLVSYRNDLEKRMDPIVNMILEGRCTTYEKYREAIGELRALKMARDLTIPDEQKKDRAA